MSDNTIQPFQQAQYYEFIHDPDQINLFDAKYLNRQSANHAYILMLFVRPKYNSTSIPVVMKHQQMYIKRTIINNSSLLKYIQSHNLPHSHFVDSSNTPLNKETMVLYININPFDRNMAFAKVQNRFITSFLDPSIKPITDFENSYKTELHNSAIPSLDRYMDLDVDTKNPNITNPLIQRFKHAISDIIETKNGYHIIIDRNLWTKPDGADLYSKFISSSNNKYIKTHDDKSSNPDEYISINKSHLFPIPGTIHGDFKNRFVSIEEFNSAL